MSNFKKNTINQFHMKNLTIGNKKIPKLSLNIFVNTECNKEFEYSQLFFIRDGIPLAYL